LKHGQEALLESTDGSRRWRVALLLAVAAAAGLAAAVLPRLPQDPAYHAFADVRALGALPRAANVLSNLAFVAAGLAGLLPRAARFVDPRERLPWLVFFGCVALVGPGSAWYHLAPSNASLVWDRLPMAGAFAALLVAALAERLGPSAARLLLPLLLASLGTVLYWWATEAIGLGDLRPYAFAQYYPLVAIPLLLALFPERYTHALCWFAGLGLYGVAKAAEATDALLLQATGVGGHTLKHLLAAGGIAVLAWMVRSRRPVDAPEPVRESVDAQRG
jgi:hypothetical protein